MMAFNPFTDACPVCGRPFQSDGCEHTTVEAEEALGRHDTSQKFRDETSALVWVLRAACEVAHRWGWEEEQVNKLLRVCWRWARDKKIPTPKEFDAEMTAKGGLDDPR